MLEALIFICFVLGIFIYECTKDQDKPKSTTQAPKHLGCNCINYAETGVYSKKEKNCISVEGHDCICHIIYYRSQHLYSLGVGGRNWWSGEVCQAKEHSCACKSLNVARCCSYREFPQACNSKTHECICDSKLIKFCRSHDHLCTCLLNYENVTRNGCLGHCKANDHPCLCKYNTYCQACNGRKHKELEYEQYHHIKDD